MPIVLRILLWRAKLSFFLWNVTGIEWFWVRGHTLCARATDRNLRSGERPFLSEAPALGTTPLDVSMKRHAEYERVHGKSELMVLLDRFADSCKAGKPDLEAKEALEAHIKKRYL